MNSVEQIIALALIEDTGLGDITTESILPEPQNGRGVIVAKEGCILAGVDVACQVFNTIDPDLICQPKFKDGQRVVEGDVILEVIGNIASQLQGERTALNFLQRLSGIATITRKYVAALDTPTVRLVDTRKTTPGWRALEKEAVRAGGGFNHRFALYDGILIKDNHIAAAGSIQRAVERVRARASHLMKIEVEVSDMQGVEAALAAGVDVIMLDNMDVSSMATAVKTINGRAIVEASGNVSLDTLKPIAATGVDVISCGALTHQARSVDLSMRINTE
ncbi:MAG: nicotinate-nucleotide diphosphorylase (carboxylating) [Desulfobacterales bacterium]|nr:MAG: nicotinate-nucleotide diphosphorylase (carboxylating) [Desulfobacterales bacterium]